MKNEYKKVISLFRLWRLFLIIIVLFFLFFLLQKNLVPNGYLKVKKIFSPNQQIYFISDLYPKSRTFEITIDKKNRYFQRIFTEPIYFKVALPRSNFNKVKVKLFYKTKKQIKIQIAMMQQKGIEVGEWKFKIRSGKITKENDLNVLEAEYQITPEFVKNNKLEFMISSPYLAKKQATIDIYKIEVELFGKKINSFSEFYEIILRTIRRLINKLIKC